MIEASVVFKELLICQVRDMNRIAARLEAVAAIRIECSKEFALYAVID